MSLIRWIKGKFDVRDFLLLIGLALLWYGLFLFLPWVSFTVTGALLIACALFMGKGE